MPTSIQEIRQSLLEKDTEFRNLAIEHSRCESQLEQIVKSSYLNSEDLVKEVELKRLCNSCHWNRQRRCSRREAGGF